MTFSVHTEYRCSDFRVPVLQPASNTEVLPIFAIELAETLSPKLD